jgi:hypothetical protein
VEVAGEEDKGVQALLPCLRHHMRHRSSGDWVCHDANHQHAQPRAQNPSLPKPRHETLLCIFISLGLSFLFSFFFCISFCHLVYSMVPTDITPRQKQKPWPESNSSQGFFFFLASRGVHKILAPFNLPHPTRGLADTSHCSRTTGWVFTTRSMWVQVPKWPIPDLCPPLTTALCG